LIVICLGALSDDKKDLINKIFSKMNIKMYNISFNILRSHPDAEEAVSQTFLKIIRNIEKISALSCPEIEPYCVIILKNETMNIIRKRKKTVYVEDVDYLNHSDEYRDIEDEFIMADNREELLSCINRLSDDEKNLIYLRFINDMSYKHISELLDITEDAARKRGQRILNKLRLYYMEGDNSVRGS
jgi:RNA polymerase sigma-70 factor (ECF subfamily)